MEKVDEVLPFQIQYACASWIRHLSEGQPHIHTLDLVEDFLKRHFLHRLEALSLSGRAANCVSLLSALSIFSQVGGVPLSL